MGKYLKCSQSIKFMSCFDTIKRTNSTTSLITNLSFIIRFTRESSPLLKQSPREDVNYCVLFYVMKSTECLCKNIGIAGGESRPERTSKAPDPIHQVITLSLSSVCIHKPVNELWENKPTFL